MYEHLDPFLDGGVHIFGELTYFGTRKGVIFAGIDRMAGESNWKIGWTINGTIRSRDKAIALYEDAYCEYLKGNEELLAWLVATASDVYDIDPSNIRSGVDYSIQECDATHLQDIAIRRVLKRLERSFQGDHLVQVRGRESEGYALNPGKVPFHRPQWVIRVDVRHPWWDKDSAEDFYQSNKVLLTTPHALKLALAVRGPGKTYFTLDKSTYYLQEPTNAKRLWRKSGREVRRLCAEKPKEYHHEKNLIFMPYAEFLEHSSASYESKPNG